MAESRSVLFRMVWALGVWVGCAGDPGSRVLSINAVETRLLSADGGFELSGDGLPFGSPASVVLSGTMHSPGRSDRSLQLTLVGRVLSPERLVVGPEAGLADALGRGSFEGRIDVQCGEPGAEQAHASLQRVSFDSEGPSGMSEQRLRREAYAVLRELRVDISDDDSRTRGLVVARAAAGGPGSGAGLRTGDVIERANGVRIHGLADLAPPPTARRLWLQVRSAAGVRREQLVPLSAAVPFADRRMLGIYGLACPILLLLLWLLPVATPGQFLARARAELRAQRSLALSWQSKCGMALACGLAGALSLFRGALDVFVVLSVHAGLVVVSRGRRSAQLAHLLVIWLGIGAVAVMTGTRVWPGIAADQGLLPWEWNAFARLPLSLAFLLCMWHAGRLHASREQSGQLARALDSLARALLAALFAALFLGGSQGLAASQDAIALASAIAAAKSLLLFGVLHLACARGPSAVSMQWACALALPISVSGWLWWVPSRAIEANLAAGLCVLLALAAIVALAEQRTARSTLTALRARTEPFV